VAGASSCKLAAHGMAEWTDLFYSAPLEEEPEPVLVPFRLTLLGPAQSGKTSLASAFVNNYCPSVYVETTDPALYYKTYHLSSWKDKDKDGQEKEPEGLNVLLEIEDTYASDAMSGRRNLDYFCHLFSTRKDHKEWLRDGASKRPSEGPFAGMSALKLERRIPFTALRMGFMVVFDCEDELSWQEAEEVHKQLVRGIEHDNDEYHLKLAPVVVLVANKVPMHRGDHSKEDLRPFNVQKTLGHAKAYASENKIELYEVSAMEVKKVKELFRKVMKEVAKREELWDPSCRASPGGIGHRTAATMRAAATEAMESGQRVVRTGQENCGVQ